MEQNTKIVENDIRPDDMKKKMTELAMIDRNNVLRNKSEFTKIPCPACESDRNNPCFEKDGFNFVCCNECETVFINPRPSLTLLNEFYTSSQEIKYWNEKIFPASENARRQKIFAPRAKRVLELCRRYNAATDILLDVGAGFGTFCEEIIKLKIFDKVIAVEPSDSLALTCKHKGLEVIQKTIEDIELYPVSVITNFELIEHLYWPEDFLIACAKALKDNGLIILSTPNIKGFDLLTLNKISDNISGPSHLNYFHPQSLKHLLTKCGFNVLEVLTPGELDAELVRKKVLNKEFDISQQAFLKRILLEQWEVAGQPFQTFLANNSLSSHLWMVASLTPKR